MTGAGTGAVTGAGSPVGPANLSGWDGARRSERRGYVVWPTLDTAKELSAHDRLEVIRKVRMGEANIGLVKRCINGAANLIGHLKPQAVTMDAEWNKRAEEAFWRRASHPQAFDMAGKMDFLGWQGVITRSKLRDGDGLSVLAEGSEKGGRVLYYEAHQVGDGKERMGAKPPNLRDGVYLDKWGGRAGYRVLAGDGSTWKVVPRERAIYHSRLERSGRPREVSGLAHAVSNFLDMVEILGDTKHAVKVAALWGVALEKSMRTDKDGEKSDALKKYLGTEGPSLEASAADIATGLRVEDITKGGRMHEVEGKLTTLQDSRPHPNTMALLMWLVRDMALGLGLLPDVLWDLSGLNGTSMRYAMADTRRFIQTWQADLKRDCQRVWMYFLAKEMNAGRLARPEGLDRWWAVDWIGQEDMTIDRGREGALELKQLESGGMTRAEYWGRRGKDWQEQERQIRVEREWCAALDGE